MKRGGLGGAILLAAAAAIAFLILDRPVPPARAPGATAPAAPEEPAPPKPPVVAVEPTPGPAEAVEKPRAGGGSLSLVIRAEDGSTPEAIVIVEPFFQPEGRRLETKPGATLEGLAPEWNRVRVLAPGYAPVFLPVRLHPGGPVELTVPLTAGATLVGTVRTPNGLPVPDAKVRSVAWGARCSATADALGAYRIDHLPPGRVEMDAEGAGGQDSAFLNLEEGREASWDPVLRPPEVLEGFVLEGDGRRVVGASVCVSSSSATESEFRELKTGEDGAFRIENCRDVTYRVSVQRPGAAGLRAAEILATPRDSPVTITLPSGEGYVRGTVVDRKGAPAARAAIRVWPVEWPDREQRVGAAADGSFRIGPFPPGLYFVELHLDGEPTLHLRPAIDVVAGETRDLGVLRFPAGGRIRVRVLDLSGAALFAWVSVLSLDGSISYAYEKDDGAFLSEELAPGSYLAVAAGLVEEVPVAAGAVVPVDLRMRPGGTLTMAAVLRDGSPTTAQCRIEDAKGRGLGTWASDGMPYLAEGDYRVLATDGRGRRGETPVRMGREDQTVILVLE